LRRLARPLPHRQLRKGVHDKLAEWALSTAAQAA